jgi:hypothetical protein
VKVPVNGQCALFWEEWPVNAQGQRREINRQLTDADITSAFIGIFTAIWKYLPESLLIRDNDAVIKHLKDQAKKLPASYD